MNIESEIINIIGENGIKIATNGVFTDIDSLRLVTTIVCLEEKFGVEFSDELYLLYGKWTDYRKWKT